MLTFLFTFSCIVIAKEPNTSFTLAPFWSTVWHSATYCLLLISVAQNHGVWKYGPVKSPYKQRNGVGGRPWKHHQQTSRKNKACQAAGPASRSRHLRLAGFSVSLHPWVSWCHGVSFTPLFHVQYFSIIHLRGRERVLRPACQAATPRRSGKLHSKTVL